MKTQHHLKSSINGKPLQRSAFFLNIKTRCESIQEVDDFNYLDRIIQDQVKGAFYQRKNCFTIYWIRSDTENLEVICLEYHIL